MEQKPGFFQNSKGRTSPSLVLGFIGGTVSLAVFLICGVSLVTKYNEGPNVQALAMHSVALFTVAASLLGIRRFTQDKDYGQNNTGQN